MTEHQRLLCHGCGVSISSLESEDGLCAACKADVDTTWNRSLSLDSTVDQGGTDGLKAKVSGKDAIPKIEDYQLIRPLVADFGLAEMRTGDSDMTTTGEVFGSPPYMSTEQATNAGQVNEAADVYSLGATLYHLIAGRPPFQAATPLETLRQVLDDQPVSPREVNRAVDVDLETIVLKCLEKEPQRRYATAEDLGEDLQAYLENRPISARPASAWDRVVRWRRRNPALAVWMSLAALFLLLGSATSLTFAILEYKQRKVAEANEALASAKTTIAQQKEAEATALAKQLEESLSEVERRRKQARQDAITSSISASFAYLQNSEPERIAARLGGLELDADELRHVGLAFNYLNRRAHLAPQVISGHTAPARAVAFSPDDQVLASAGEDFVVELWDSSTGRHLRTLQSASAPVTAPAFSPQGGLLATGSRTTGASHDSRVDLWDYEKGNLVTTIPHHCSVQALRFSRDGKVLVSATADQNELGEISVYDTKDWSLARKLSGHKPGNPGHIWGVADIDILWDNRQLVSAGFDGKVKLWDLTTGQEQQTLAGHTGWVRSIAFDSTGKSIVSGSDDKTLRFWDTKNGQPTQIFRDGVGVTTTLCYDREFRNLVTASGLGVLTWNLQTKSSNALGKPRSIEDIALSHDGTKLAAARVDGKLEVWNTSDWSVLTSLDLWISTMSRITFSADGRWLTASADLRSHAILDTESNLWRIHSDPDRVIRRFAAWLLPDDSMAWLNWKDMELTAWHGKRR